MRVRDLETLEFPLVLDAVASGARSVAGREWVRARKPQREAAAVTASLDLLADVLSAVDRHDYPPTADVVVLEPILALAAVAGAALEARQLTAVRDFLEVTRQVRSWVQRDTGRTPHLLDLSAPLAGGRGVAGSLSRALDARGLVRDDASPALERARAAQRSLHGQIEARLLRLVRDPNLRHVIGDDYVTIRNGRFVVPVRASHPNAIPGVVLDRSASDETLFIEPLFAVELNNRLLLAGKEAEVEERRVRVELTGLIGDDAPALAAAEEALSSIDGLAALARFTRTHDCTRPTLGGEAITLRGVRHPLLLAPGRTVVPIDIVLRADQRGLAITGPNAGGKTVALKTLGLCVLLAQAGMYVPARLGAELPLCSGVLVDIGDEQSIAHDLSTFTAHATNLAAIAVATQADSLVLLDEPGAGTDPVEGAALAIGVLTDLLERAARVVFTTHFVHVKTFVLSEPRLEVAAFDVDATTGAPTFRLAYRTVGRSFALPIARRHGVPPRAIEVAERYLAGESQEIGQAVDRLEESRRSFEEGRDALAAERAGLERERAEAAALTAELRARKRQHWAEQLDEARRFLRSVRTRGESVLEEVRQKASPEPLRAFVRETEREIVAHQPPPESLPPSRPLKIGDRVEVIGRGIHGELVELSGPRARIHRGGLRFEVATDQLRLVDGAQSRPTVDVRVARPDEDERLDEIRLIGRRTREALDALAAFLDRASRAGMIEVRIVHGMGSGALRKAVQEYLATSSYCAGFHDGDPSLGGAGVTIAQLV